MQSLAVEVPMDPLQAAAMAEQQDRRVFNTLKDCTVKLTMANDAGSWHGSGFWFSDQPLIATAAHLLNLNGRTLTSITASYPSGPDETVQVGALLCVWPISRVAEAKAPDGIDYGAS